MRINPIRIITLLFIAILLISCGASVPSESDARAVFEKKYEKEIKDGTIKITNFRKVDGQSGELLGVKLYSLKYEAELEYPRGLECRAITNLCGWGSFDKKVGEKETRNGEINFEKTENGWQVLH